MAYVRQTNFSGGEVSPLLWGRTDLEVYGRAARRLRNFLPTPPGPAVSRPGTVYVSATKAAAAVRLVPFIFSDEQSYVLEFGPNYIRFHTRGGTVLSGGVPYEVVTPYTAQDLRDLQWAQSGDILTLTHELYPPKELSRFGHTNWTLTDVAFDRPLATLSAVAVGSAGVPDATHPAREWEWRVTEVRRDERGYLYESAPFDGPSGSYPVYADLPLQLSLTSTYGALATDPNFIAYRVYRGRGGAFGWVGDTDTNTFTDTGKEPDYAQPPPQGLNPFKVYNADGSLARTEHPRAVAFFEERRVFAGTTKRPGFIWLSATGDYANFDERLIASADEALVFELACRKREDIRALVGLRRLIALTNASAWAVGGAAGEPISPTSIDAKVQVEIGATLLPALSVGGAVLYGRNKGVGVRALVYDDNGGGFVGMDVSTIAQHLFSPQGLTKAPYHLGSLYHPAGPQSAAELVAWTYAEDPFGVIWAVRADGMLLSLTYSHGAQTWAWAWHDTDGYVLDVCSVPEADEDAVYLITVREVFGSGAHFAIERMASRVRRGTTDDDICVDCAQKYAGPPVMLITGVDAFAGRDDVWVVGKDNPPVGPLKVSGNLSDGTYGHLELPELPIANDGDEVVLWVGLRYTPEMETLDVGSGDARLRQKTLVSVGFEVDQSKGLEVGQDFDHLDEWRQRDVGSGYAAISAATELVTMPVRGGWDSGARAALRQTLPLPVTILGITREVDVGG